MSVACLRTHLDLDWSLEAWLEKVYRTSLEPRLVEAAMLSSLRRKMEMRRSQVQSKARVQGHTASRLPNGPLTQGASQQVTLADHKAIQTLAQ